MKLVLAHKLVWQYGGNATSYQILNPGIKLWFSKQEDAVVGFLDWGRVRVVAGAPICSKARLPQVVEEFEEDTCNSAGASVCYFAAGSDLEGLLRQAPGYSQVLVGAQPVWHPHSWPGILSRHSSLRAQLYRARNKSISIRPWSVEEAARNPGIRLCLQEWLAAKPMPPMHFLVEPQILDRLWDRKIFVAEKLGMPVGFLIATPVPARQGWLIEQIVQGSLAPNGTAELLIDAAFQQAKQAGLDYFTLGLSPLSQVQPEGLPQPGWIRFTLECLRIHGRRYYDFRGLETFKSKFIPDYWEPIYAICNRPKWHPLHFLAIAGVFGGGSLLPFIIKSISKVVQQQALRFVQNPNKIQN